MASLLPEREFQSLLDAPGGAGQTDEERRASEAKRLFRQTETAQSVRKQKRPLERIYLGTHLVCLDL